MTARPLLIAALAILASVGPAAADEVTALQAVRAQPRVIDAVIDNGGNLYVSVKPTAGAWSQFGSHLCNVVRPHHARIFRVRVVDITTVAGGRPQATWKKLAEAKCS